MIVAITAKNCTRCKAIKSADAFPPRKDKRDGLASHCRACISLTAKKKYVKIRGVQCARCVSPCLPGLKVCAACQARKAQNALRLRGRRREDGRCPHCGGMAAVGRRACLPCQSASNAKKNSNNAILRQEVIERYGGACDGCQESIPAFLTVDHIGGGGGGHRRQIGMDFYRWLRNKGFPQGFRLLCYNCNIADHVARQDAIPKKTPTYLILYRRRLKEETMRHYGPGCRCCGVDDLRVLTIDHIARDGSADRARFSYSFGGEMIYRSLRNKGWPSGYQTLCYNCNCGREKFDGVCPHKATPLSAL